MIVRSAPVLLVASLFSAGGREVTVGVEAGGLAGKRVFVYDVR